MNCERFTENAACDEAGDDLLKVLPWTIVIKRSYDNCRVYRARRYTKIQVCPRLFLPRHKGLSDLRDEASSIGSYTAVPYTSEVDIWINLSILSECFKHRIDNRLCAEDIGNEKYPVRVKRTGHMCFRCKMHNDIRLCRQGRSQGRGYSDRHTRIQTCRNSVLHPGYFRCLRRR